MKALLIIKRGQLERQLQEEKSTDKILSLRIELANVLQKINELENTGTVNTHAKNWSGSLDYNLQAETAFFTALAAKSGKPSAEEIEAQKAYSPRRLRWLIEAAIYKAENAPNNLAKLAATSDYRNNAEAYNLAVNFAAYDLNYRP